MAMKEYTSAVLVIRINDDETPYMLNRAKKVVVSVKGKHRAYTFTGDSVVIFGDTVAIGLSPGQTGNLGVGPLSVEVTFDFPDGTVLKTKTLSASIAQSVRREMT